MSGFIGMCLKNGAFLSADTRRTDLSTGKYSTIQKIYQLSPNVYIATGGRGSISHIAKEKLVNKVNMNDISLNNLITEAQTIFRQAFNDSNQQYVNSNIPLYVIFAGRDYLTNSGFICVLRSN